MPCEVAVRSVVPAIRASIAKELICSYKMKQNDVAKILGVTQTAVSKYARHVRGEVIKINRKEEIGTLVQKIAYEVSNQQISGPRLVARICEVCIATRRAGLMCELCKRSDPALNIQECQICKLPGAGCTSS